MPNTDRDCPDRYRGPEHGNALLCTNCADQAALTILGGTHMQPSDDHLDPDAVATSAEDGDPLLFASDEDSDHDPFTDYPPGGGND
jgi:hypothetical protein